MYRVAAFLVALVTLLPLAVTASEEECIQLAYIRPHRPQVVSSEARVLFNDVNAARAQRGLPPLVPDEALSQFALQVAQQMAQRRYFGHTDPNGVTFQDRLRAAGLHMRFAAENMAFDQDEAHAHQAFLHSPGHYANIVDMHPHKLGIAVVAAGDGEVFYVEEFAD
ncbi:MAG: hypothetical protein QOJ39_360 [Candidatus Eremiobacteraeota bacterium]|jgi:uncharacterized protein YkwD|nr:hypothetical protein [Candidatus Eremiobacteraeota bacterium]